MKCERIQQKILLAHSDELSWLGSRALSRHLRDCAECRQFEAALNGIAAQVHSSEADLSLDAAVLDRIRHAARKESSRNDLIYIRPSHEPFFSVFRPAIIYSALAIMLLVGFWLTLRPALNQPQVAEQKTTPAVGEGWDTATIDTQIEDLSDSLDVAAADEEITATESDDVDSLARELLELEGQQI